MAPILGTGSNLRRDLYAGGTVADVPPHRVCGPRLASRPPPGCPPVVQPSPSQRSEPKAPSTPRQALSQLAAPHRYRVSLDAEGWPVIPGKLEQIECHDGQALAVYSTRPRIFARLWTVPGVRRWQVGDQEARGLVPLERLPEVASLIQARRRRRGRPLTSEQALKLRARARIRATSAGSEPV
jgi:hypothetical protein